MVWTVKDGEYRAGKIDLSIYNINLSKTLIENVILPETKCNSKANHNSKTSINGSTECNTDNPIRFVASNWKKNQVVLKKLKKGKTYGVKVRGYVVVNGKKYYSSYSKVKCFKR